MDASQGIMKKLLLTGIAALFLATGTAQAHEFVVLLQEGNETICCFCHNELELCRSFGA